jgi:hypothetical protein
MPRNLVHDDAGQCAASPGAVDEVAVEHSAIFRRLFTRYHACAEKRAGHVRAFPDTRVRRLSRRPNPTSFGTVPKDSPSLNTIRELLATLAASCRRMANPRTADGNNATDVSRL